MLKIFTFVLPITVVITILFIVCAEVYTPLLALWNDWAMYTSVLSAHVYMKFRPLLICTYIKFHTQVPPFQYTF